MAASGGGQGAPPPAAVSSCPFGFGTPKDHTHHAGQGRGGGCPLGFGWKREGAPSDSAPATPEAASSSGAAGKCPFGFGGKREGAPSDSAPATPVSSEGGAASLSERGGGGAREVGGSEGGPGAVCPYGYGGGSGPRLGELSCVLCRSLLYEAVTTSCSHTFCAACIARFEDCPVCGADIAAAEPNEQLRSMVDKFISAMSGRLVVPEVAEMGEDTAAFSQRPTEFLLKLGTHALAGGNFDAAFARLGLCREELAALLAGGDEDRPGLLLQLGTVLGAMGDALRRGGDSAGAREHYQRSLEHLGEAPGTWEDVVQGLSVSHNKLGDLAYWEEDLAGARHHYVEALAVRKGAAAKASPPPIGLVLDIAVSLAKVADVDEALGDERGARASAEEAKVLVEGIGPIEDPALERKRAGVLMFVAS